MTTPCQIVYIKQRKYFIWWFWNKKIHIYL